MPYGVVHLKAKKQWRKGRTIISYSKSCYGPLLRVTSNVLNTMIYRLLPQSPGQLSTPQLWNHFHDYLQHTPVSVDLHAVNDDLVGFFNSVPQDRLIQAVQSLVNRWQHTFTTPTITVDTHTHTHPEIQSSLPTLAVITANIPHNGHCTRTTSPRLSGIGSQLPPALCNAAITLIEHSWHQLHHPLTDHTEIHFVYYRYVDNRFIAFNSIFLKHLAIQTLIHPDFYGNPVELEPVEDMHLLGFDVDLRQRTISYIPPDASWKIRDNASAGSTRLRLSGLQSRAHLIRKYTYPSSAVERALAQLTDLYVQKGHDLRSCRQALRGKVPVFGRSLATQRTLMQSAPSPAQSVCVTTCF